MMSMFFFFFFQAEDGIRDVAVTGVQTCALPICALGEPPGAPGGDGRIIEALVWQSHAGLLEASWPTDGCAYSTITGRGAAPRGRHSRPLLPRELSARHRGARRGLRRARGPGEPQGPGPRPPRGHRAAPRRGPLGPRTPRPRGGQSGRPAPRPP